MTHQLTPELLLRAYTSGIFPMAEARTSTDVFWVEPQKRGVLPLQRFHSPHSLAKLLRSDRFTVTADRAFEDVLRGCAEPVPGRPDTWINPMIHNAYVALHEQGNAHSIECWQGGTLVGGLYGVSIGAAFFGESMFTRVRDASKVALAHLVARLRVGGYKLLDTQFLTEHLARFGTIEIGRAAYRTQLGVAVSAGADFFALDAAAAAAGLCDAATVPGPVSGKLIAQLLTQTS